MNFSLDVDIIKNMLSAKVLYGLNKENTSRDSYIPSDVYYALQRKSRGNLGYGKRQQSTLEGTLTFQHKFGELLDMNLMAGMGRYLDSGDGSDISYENANDHIQGSSVGMADGPFYPTSYKYKNEKRSQFVRGNFDLLGRYVVSASLRRDGTDKFFPSKKYALFPSVSLAWKMNEESFIKNISWINMLKLRASYGETGSDNLGTTLYGIVTTTREDVQFNNNSVTYIPYILSGANYEDVTWQKTVMKNIGLDFGFFGNALTGTVDIFQRDTKDMLGPGLEFPDMFGAVAPQANNARMRNRGWELSLNYRGKIGNDIDYSVGGSVSDAVSEVTEYANAKKNDPYGSWYTGRKVGEIWGYRAEGLIQTQEEADAYNAEYDLSYISGKLWEPGDVKYIDLDGNKVIDRGDNRLVDGDMGDQTIIGNTTPRYQYTFNGYISWKGLSLSVMFQGVGKRDWVAGGAYFWGFGPYAQVTVFKEHMDYWRPDNPGAYYPKPYINSAGGVAPYQDKNIQRTDLYLQNAAYCRLKNLTLSYDLPNAWVHKAGLQKVQVFFSGENLLTFTKLKGMFDPEAIFSSNSYTSEGGKNYPMNRVLSLGFIVNL